jgi:hypothetical protein
MSPERLGFGRLMGVTITERRDGPWCPSSGAAYHLLMHDPEAAFLPDARTVEVTEFDADDKLIVRTVVDFAAESEWEPAEGGGMNGGVSRVYDANGQLLRESRVWIGAGSARKPSSR